MAALFGTSGIRGLYGTEVSCSLAMKVGAAVGSNCKKLIIAIDARATSPLLSEALAAGAMSTGAEVVFLGMAPTPLLAYATMKGKCAGAMITASHNPPEYNGIKLFKEGREFSEKEENEVEALLAAPRAPVEWDKAGQRKNADLQQEFVSFLLSKVDAAAIAKRKPRVLVDCGNAAASPLAPALLRAAGCEVVGLYCSEPGRFERNLEPKSETLSAASKLLVEKKCDFGVAFDGDGDRAIAIDERGRVLALDAQLAVFSSYFLAKSKSKKVVSTVEASLSVREAVEEAGGEISITPVGSRHVAEEVKRRGACFGGEPCGEYVFPQSTPCADGLLAALFVADIFCARGKLSALASAVKTYPIERKKYKCEGRSKEKIMAALSRALVFPGAKLSKIDGIRLDFPDGWLLVRPSGTEPAIRLTCEFREKEKLQKTVASAEKEILSAISKG